MCRRVFKHVAHITIYFGHREHSGIVKPKLMATRTVLPMAAAAAATVPLCKLCIPTTSSPPSLTIFRERLNYCRAVGMNTNNTIETRPPYRAQNVHKGVAHFHQAAPPLFSRRQGCARGHTRMAGGNLRGGFGPLGNLVRVQVFRFSWIYIQTPPCLDNTFSVAGVSVSH